MSGGSITINEVEWRTYDFERLPRTSLIPDQALYIGKLFVGGVMHISSRAESRKETPWRGWFMSYHEGEETGWFATADEARRSVQDALNKALS
jgi:hypothetical protein